jgi:hypothetical protein
MIYPAGQKLLAVVECLLPRLDDAQAERALRFMMNLAGEGSARDAAEQKRREAERSVEEQALASAGDPVAIARRAREPA